MHFNIPEDYFQYREALLISLYVGISQLNGQLTGVTLDQVIDRIAKCKFIADRETIAKYFDYHNRQFSLQMGGDEYSLNL